MSGELGIHKRDIEKKATIFRLILDQISFMHDGMNFLKLTVASANNLSKRGIRFRAGNSEKFLNDYTVKTEMIGPIKKNVKYNFETNEYNFYLPKGFCKNDIHHDVYILIEAFQVGSDAHSKLIGEIKLPIFPRSDVVANYDREIGEPFYQTKAVIRLFKIDKNSSNLHCGDLHYQADFSEIYEIIEAPESVKSVTPFIPEPPKKEKKTKIVEIGASSDEKSSNKPLKRDGAMIEIGTFPFSELKVEEKLKEKLPWPKNAVELNQVYNTLAPPDKEELSIIVHAAENVYNKQGNAVRAYIVCLQRLNKPLSDTAYESTTVSDKASSFTKWEEILNLSYNVETSQKYLSLLLIDDSDDEIITEFLLPIRPLTPFLQHHLKLIQANSSGLPPIKLYITIIRKKDCYPAPTAGCSFSALVIKALHLQYYQEYISTNKRMYCFAYLSNNYKMNCFSKPSIDENFEEIRMPIDLNYRYLSPTVNVDKINMGQVNPSPTTYSWSHGQLSIASLKVEINSNRVVWNFPLVFVQPQEIDTAFSVNSAVIIDFFEIGWGKTSNSVSWQPVANGDSVIIPLDKSLYHQLTSPQQFSSSYIRSENGGGVNRYISNYGNSNNSANNLSNNNVNYNKYENSRCVVKQYQLTEKSQNERKIRGTHETIGLRLKHGHDVIQQVDGHFVVLLKLGVGTDNDSWSTEKVAKFNDNLMDEVHVKNKNKFLYDIVPVKTEPYKLDKGLMTETFNTTTTTNKNNNSNSSSYIDYIEKQNHHHQHHHPYNQHHQLHNQQNQLYRTNLSLRNQTNLMWSAEETAAKPIADYNELVKELDRMRRDLIGLQKQVRQEFKQIAPPEQDQYNSVEKYMSDQRSPSKQHQQMSSSDYLKLLQEAVNEKERWIQQLQRKINNGKNHQNRHHKQSVRERNNYN